VRDIKARVVMTGKIGQQGSLVLIALTVPNTLVELAFKTVPRTTPYISVAHYFTLLARAGPVAAPALKICVSTESLTAEPSQTFDLWLWANHTVCIGFRWSNDRSLDSSRQNKGFRSQVLGLSPLHSITSNSHYLASLIRSYMTPCDL
jgi:hypothetical protein